MHRLPVSSLSAITRPLAAAVSLVRVWLMAAPVITSGVTAVTMNGSALPPASPGNRTRSPTSTAVVKSPVARVNVFADADTSMVRPATVEPDCHELVIAPASNSSWLDALNSMAYSPATCLLPVRMAMTPHGCRPARSTPARHGLRKLDAAGVAQRRPARARRGNAGGQLGDVELGRVRAPAGRSIFKASL